MEESFQALPKHNGAAYVSNLFALNKHVSPPLTNI